MSLMAQLKDRGHPDAPPAIATDGKGSYREAMVETWGQVPEYKGRGKPATRKQPQPGWQYLKVIKREGSLGSFRGTSQGCLLRMIGCRGDRHHPDDPWLPRLLLFKQAFKPGIGFQGDEFEVDQPGFHQRQVCQGFFCSFHALAFQH